MAESSDSSNAESGKESSDVGPFSSAVASDLQPKQTASLFACIPLPDGNASDVVQAKSLFPGYGNKNSATTEVQSESKMKYPIRPSTKKRYGYLEKAIPAETSQYNPALF